MSMLGWLKDLFTGKRPEPETKGVRLQWEVCEKCKGAGSVPDKDQCRACGGRGKVEVAIFPEDGDPKWSKCRYCGSPTTKRIEDGRNLYRCTAPKCGWQLSEITGKGDSIDQDECPRCSGIIITDSSGKRACGGYQNPNQIRRANERTGGKLPESITIPPCGWSER